MNYVWIIRTGAVVTDRHFHHRTGAGGRSADRCLYIGDDTGGRVAVNTSTNTILAAEVALAQSDDECVVCHTNHTPGIVNQYLGSDHYSNATTCADCHLVEETVGGAVQHPESEFYVLPRSSSAMCETCHRTQVEQFNLSRHALPSYVAYAGSEGLSAEHQALYASIPEGGFNPEAMIARNAIHRLEGPEFTRFSCESCHDVGKPNLDGSVGDQSGWLGW